MPRFELPPKPIFRDGVSLRFDVPPMALQRWNPAVSASSAADENEIGIYDQIGDDGWGGGFTAKRMAAALRHIGSENPVTVNINSPGGDLFEGLAIYSLLREHKGQVTTNVLSLAASAASIIGMAGDVRKISRAGFYMIHNAWTYAVGNRHDFREIANYLEPFDESMASIYSHHIGLELKEMQALMDKESWIGGTQAVEMGFANSFLDSDDLEISSLSGSSIAAKKLDVALAKAGLSRKDRRELLNQYKASTPSAAGDGDTPSAIPSGTPSAVERRTEGKLLNLSQQLAGIFPCQN